MFNDPGTTTIVQKRMSFLTATVLGATCILVTAIISTAGIAVYGLRIVDRKSDSLVGMIGKMAGDLPALQDALPPVLFDAIDDERQPEYLKNVKVNVRLTENKDHRLYRRAIVEVQNNGDSTISLLSMRVVGMDGDGDPVCEKRTWAATPLQLDGDDWRGPLLPHETRRFVVRSFNAEDVNSVSHEITEIRVWRGYQDVAEPDDKSELATGRRTGKANASHRLIEGGQMGGDSSRS